MSRLEPVDQGACAYVTCLRVEEHYFERPVSLSDGTRLTLFPDGVCLFDFTSSHMAPRIDAFIDQGDPSRSSEWNSAWKETEERVATRCQFINSFASLLSTGMATFQSHMVPLDHVLTAATYFPLAPHDLHNVYNQTLVLGHFSKVVGGSRRGIPISRDAIDWVILKLEEVAKNADQRQLIDLLAKASDHYSRHDFSICAVVGWSVVENLLNRIWSAHVARIRSVIPGKINAKRFERLTEKFSAESLVEIADLSGLLPDGVYARIGEARKARNDWMHFLEPVSDAQGSNSIRLAEELFEHVYGYRLRIPINRSSYF